MVGSFANDTITRIRPGTKNVRGSDIPDWDNVSVLDIVGCSFQPSTTSLSQDGRVSGISDSAICFCPYNTDIKADDRVQFDGLIYTVIGEPRKWKSPTGNRNNLQINLERWSG